MIDPEAGSAPAVTGRRPPWRDLPTLIIIVTGLFHFGRGAPVDGLIFVSIGVALVVAELRDRNALPPAGTTGDGSRLGARWVLLGALLCVAYGWLVGHWERASLPVVLAVAVPGLLILPLAWRVGPVRRADRAGPGKWAWAGVMLLVCLWELFSFLHQPGPRIPSYDHPTLSVVLDPLFESPAVRSVLLVGWLGTGLWLARRLFTVSRGRQTDHA